MQTISAQKFRDEATVEAKRAAGDYEVFVSPVFEIEGEQFRVIMDGHHSMEAAILDGVEPDFIEQSARDNDTVALIAAGDIDDFLAAHRNDCDYYDIATGHDIW